MSLSHPPERLPQEYLEIWRALRTRMNGPPRGRSWPPRWACRPTQSSGFSSGAMSALSR